MLGMNLVEFQGCIEFIDGMLIKICKSWNDGTNKVWFNRQKKIYSMINTMVVDHQGLFIYLDSRYLGSYHDVTILCQSELCQFFLHGDEYFEYLVGDYGYLSEEMFIMRKIGRHEIGPNDQDVIKAYNKMHRVWVKWGLGDWWIEKEMEMVIEKV
jgi:hypothetical protein